MLDNNLITELSLSWIRKTKLYKELTELNVTIRDLITELSSKNLPKDINSDLKLESQQTIDYYFTRKYGIWDLRRDLDIQFSNVSTIPVVVIQGRKDGKSKYIYRVGKRKLAPLLKKYEDLILKLERRYEVFSNTLALNSRNLTYSDVKKALDLNDLKK